jgi:DNA-3-methyladenine glycosylase
VSHLRREFFARDTRLVARELLGKSLVHISDDGKRRGGRIVETEAYVGPDDAASHARTGPTGRGKLMWGKPGVAYVYLIYGLHHCFNVVTERDGFPGAVLVRALEPLDDTERANGPALVCRALRIDRGCNGVDLTESVSLFIEGGPSLADTRVRMGPRIGVDYAGDWAAHPWRLWIADSEHVSRRAQTGIAYDSALR